MKKFLITMSIIAIIVLGIYYPIVWLIIGIGLIIVIVLIFILIRNYDKSDDLFMKNKFGENYRDLIKDGKLGLRTAYSCKPDSYYTSKEEMEKPANISLPDFVIKECKETLADFTGDYSGEASIEFCKAIDNSVILQIEEDMKKEHSRWRKGKDEDECTCNLSEPDLSSTTSKDEYWRLILRRGSNLGKIVYGRV